MTSAIYLDNAATTNYKPQCVIDAVTNTLMHYSVNVNRNNSPLALKLQQDITNSRLALSSLVGDSSLNVALTSGCTMALNLAIFGLAKPNGHVVTTCCQHNSVLRPLNYLTKHNIGCNIVYPTDTLIKPSEITSKIQKNTYMVVLNHTSNVTGTTQDIYSLSSAVKAISPNIIVLVDVAQSIGYTNVDMTKDIDVVALPMHKGLHGVQGVGALIFKSHIQPRPLIRGGTGTESNNLNQPTSIPDGLEAGTLNSSGIVSIKPAVDWVNNNKQYISNHISCLQNTLVDGLKSMSNITLYSSYNNCGIVSFNVANYDSNYVCDLLTSQNIICRGGVQCAPLMHKHLGTEETGVVRLSVGCDNSLEQCYKVLNIISDIN